MKPQHAQQTATEGVQPARQHVRVLCTNQLLALTRPIEDAPRAPLALVATTKV